MTYVKPQIVVHGEGNAAEWAVPQKPISQEAVFQTRHVSMSICTGSSCACTSGQARA